MSNGPIWFQRQASAQRPPSLAEQMRRQQQSGQRYWVQRPQPPAQQGRCVTGRQGCPLAARTPCDVQRLEVTARVQGEHPANRGLVATRRLRGTPVNGRPPPTVEALLNRFDLVIDVVAGYPSHEDGAPEQRVQIVAHSAHFGTCSLSQHPCIVAVQETASGSATGRPTTVRGTQFTSIPLYANSSAWDFNHGNDLQKIFDLLTSIWPSTNPRMAEIRAESCGVRPPNTVRPITYLNAMVRIFRNDVWGFSFRMPPLGRYEAGAARSWGVRGASTRSSNQAYGVGFDHRTGSSSATTRRSTTGATTREISQSNYRGSEGQSRTITRDQQNGAARLVSERQSTSGGARTTRTGGATTTEALEANPRPDRVSLVIRRNGRELALGRNLQEVFDAICRIRDTIASVLNTLRRAPQLGWSASGKISVLEGSIEAQLHPYMVPQVVAGRYYPVTAQFSLVVNLKLLDISVEVSFGITCMAAGTGIDIRITGSIKLEVPVEVRILDSHEPFSADLTPSVDCRLTALCEVRALGWTLVRGQVNVNGGFDLDRGQVVVDPARGLRIVGTIRRRETTLRGELRGPVGAPYLIDPPIRLIAAGNLYTLR